MVAFYNWEYVLAIKQSPVYTDEIYWVIKSHSFILNKIDHLYFVTILYLLNFLRYKKWAANSWALLLHDKKSLFHFRAKLFSIKKWLAIYQIKADNVVNPAVGAYRQEGNGIGWSDGAFCTSGNPNLSPDGTFRAAGKAITGTVWVARAKSRPLRRTISRSRLWTE